MLELLRNRWLARTIGGFEGRRFLGRGSSAPRVRTCRQATQDIVLSVFGENSKDQGISGLGNWLESLFSFRLHIFIYLWKWYYKIQGWPAPPGCTCLLEDARISEKQSISCIYTSTRTCPFPPQKKKTCYKPLSPRPKFQIPPYTFLWYYSRPEASTSLGIYGVFTFLIRK